MQPQYIKIKSALLEEIEAGKLQPGDQVQSENQLTEQFGVSRMTARRALTELVEEGFLFRSQGLGTFVSDHRPMSSMMQINSIDDEIQQRGHQYKNKVIRQKYLAVDRTLAAIMAVDEHQQLAFSRIVHFEENIAIQVEDRWVHPKYSQDYLAQDFSKITANQYLSKIAPLTEADHSIEAVLPDNEYSQLLAISKQQPCLQITRRTYANNGIVSFAKLIHPGNRYRLGGHLDFHSELTR